MVNAAEKMLRDVLLEIMTKMDLTELEYLQVVSRVLSGEIASYCKYGIRMERHGDTDTPGDAA